MYNSKHTFTNKLIGDGLYVLWCHGPWLMVNKIFIIIIQKKCVKAAIFQYAELGWHMKFIILN